MSKIDQDEKELFFRAMELENGDEIDSFLDENCADDPEKRQRLCELLKHHQTDDRILDHTVVHLPSLAKDRFEEPASGDVIGHYKLIQKIGEGGMGLVYRARSDHHQNEVALKVIKLGMDTKQVVARFQAESHSLSMMNHPAITQILDVGSTAEGRPYFVMELVDGRPIHQFCHEMELDLRQRIDLFIQVCQGVQHAHQKGIIHRDIKPSNVLVQQNFRLNQSDSDGPTETFSSEKTPNQQVTPRPQKPIQPKIIDFGIAKAVDRRFHIDSFMTSHGEFLGTPAFMSPEQAAGDSSQIDTRSDVYGLGALLYRITVGCSPYQFDQKSMPEIQRQISEVLPAIPSIKARKLENQNRNFKGVSFKQLQGDLDWVIMKCLSKKPSDRYNSPKELIDDLIRFLDGDPVEAAAPSKLYQIKKFAAKNIGLIASGTAILVLVIAGWIITSFYAIEARQLAQRAVDAEKEAKQNYLEAVAARKESERDRDKARKAEGALSQIVRKLRQKNIFYKVLLEADPDVQVQKTLIVPGEPAHITSVPAIKLQPMKINPSANRNVEEVGTIVASFGDEQVTLPYQRIVVPAKLATAARPQKMAEQYETVPLHNKHTIQIPFLERFLEEQRKEFREADPEIKETLRLLAQHYLEAEKVVHATDALCDCYEIAKDTQWLRQEQGVLGSEYSDAIANSEKVKECKSVLEEVKTRIESEGPRAKKLKQAIDQVLDKLKKDSEKSEKSTPLSKIKTTGRLQHQPLRPKNKNID